MRALGEEEPGAPPEVSDLAAADLADDAILVTYKTMTAKLIGVPVIGLAATHGHWQVRFHQGTPLPG